MTQVWAIIAQKGGAGKTTVALHVGIELVQAGHSVTILDVDPQQSAAKWGLQRKGRLPTIRPILAPEVFDAVEFERKAQTEFVLIDTSPRADRDSLIVAKAADLIVVPVRPSPLDLPAVKDTFELMARGGYEDKVVVLLNAVASKTDEGKLATDYLTKSLKQRVCPSWFGERVDYRRSLLAGKGVTEAKTKSPAVAEVKRVTKWLIKHAEEIVNGKKSVRATG